MRGARFRDEKLCSCAGWRLNCGGTVITVNTVDNCGDEDHCQYHLGIDHCQTGNHCQDREHCQNGNEHVDR